MNCIQALMKQEIQMETQKYKEKIISLEIYFSISVDYYPFDKQNSHPAQIRDEEFYCSDFLAVLCYIFFVVDRC